jgi:ubiquinone/menaquinone biosynthesis C-methylase UbiE
MDPSSPPHSAAHFGAVRDFWWNHDYLELLARRFCFASVESVLDVGAGIGHWGMLLASVLPRDASIVGLERDPRWLTEADRRRAERDDSGRFRFDQGVAEALPYEDESFDLVTCQTLLMHVADPEAVIGEMVRVAKPGGLVLASEPNNRISMLVETSFTSQQPVEAKLQAIRFLLLYERGKMMLGEGNSSVGDLVPGYFAAAGLTRIQTYMNDNATFMVPPYDEEGQRVHAAQRAEFSKQGVWWGISGEEALRYFVAGGGLEGEFDPVWTQLLEQQRSEVRSAARHELHTAGGDIHYIVGGRRA